MAGLLANLSSSVRFGSLDSAQLCADTMTMSLGHLSEGSGFKFVSIVLESCVDVERGAQYPHILISSWYCSHILFDRCRSAELNYIHAFAEMESTRREVFFCSHDTDRARRAS